MGSDGFRAAEHDCGCHGTVGVLLALAPCRGHRLVGKGEQRLRLGAVIREAAGYDARGHLRLILRQSEKPSLANRSAQVADAMLRDLGWKTREEDAELVAAEPSEDVAFAHRQAKAVRYLAEHYVALHYPDFAIDLTEAIDVAQNEDRGLAGCAAAIELLAQPGEEGIGPQQAGQQIALILLAGGEERSAGTDAARLGREWQ